MNSFFAQGWGIRPSEKLPRGFCLGRWSGLELTDTLPFPKTQLPFPPFPYFRGCNLGKIEADSYVVLYHRDYIFQMRKSMLDMSVLGSF